MAINFSSDTNLGEVGNRISTPGRVVQVIQTTSTAAINNATTSPADLMTSSAITLTAAGNKILIEFHSDNRVNDWGDGAWNLYYMDLIHVQTGTQITYSGYRGELTNSIRHFHKVATHTPGSVGPHSYKIRGWSYSALNTTFNGGASWVDNDGIMYIRLMEVAV